jgi:hypothetical protein
VALTILRFVRVCRVTVQARDFGANRSLAYQDVASMLSQMLGGRNIPYGQIFNGLKQAFGGSLNRKQPTLHTLYLTLSSRHSFE